ncbi:hypothetical protein ABZP36_004211 [Zizania latifolia]
MRRPRPTTPTSRQISSSTSRAGRLIFVDRLASAVAFGCSVKLEAPWLVFPAADDTPETNKIYSIADRHIATARAPDLSMRDCYVMGSSGGWIVTTDKRAHLYMVNPVTGEQHALPAITTSPFFFVPNPSWPLCHVNISQDEFVRVR